MPPARSVLFGLLALTGKRVGQSLGLRHCDFVTQERRIEIVSREDNASGARGKGFALAMTARYAHIKDQTLRREWERYQQRTNVRGEAISLDPDGPHSDAAWALENLARAKQTLPNGYCGLPLQQRCPHPNACLSCDNFLTTAEFLSLHRDQLGLTEQLIAAAQHNVNTRLEMNEPVRINLVRIIEGLETLDPDGERDVA